MLKRRALTIVELLVVSCIIVLLAGIMVPTIAKARTSAKRTRCAAQLQDIGRMFQMYLGEHKNTLPRLNPMPSFRPLLNGYPSLAELLAPYHRGGGRVFQCPADEITYPTTGTPAGYARYYDREGASYRWNAMLNLRSTRITDLGAADTTVLIEEYEPFHAKAGAAGSMNHLFADFHVGDSEGSNLVIILR